MVKVLGFFVCTLFLIASIGYVTTRLPSADPFSVSDTDRAIDLRYYSLFQIATLKQQHAAALDTPYDIGLFGNSRILSVGRSDLSLEKCSVFNFALSGQSFRSTVELLERLAAQDALPRTAVVSMDHFELQMADNPQWIPIADRVYRFLNDITYAVQSDIASVRDAARVVWRFVWTETLLFQQIFEVAFFYQSVSTYFDLHSLEEVGTEASNALSYRNDGSWDSGRPSSDGAVDVLARTTAQILLPILQLDLDRLFNLARDNNFTIFLYESPLHHESSDLLDVSPSSFANADRQLLKAACAEAGIQCLTAPIGAFLGSSGWSDSSHPPADELGLWLSMQLARVDPGCAT